MFAGDDFEGGGELNGVAAVQGVIKDGLYEQSRELFVPCTHDGLDCFKIFVFSQIERVFEGVVADGERSLWIKGYTEE